MTVSIDVVIVAFGRWDLTESCLRHLEAQTVPHQVYLVDNGSTEAILTNVAREFPRVQTTRLERNSAYAHACNLGVAQGSGDLVVPLNNDVDCRPDFLERLVAPLEADLELGTVAPLLLQPGERAIDCVGLAADSTLAGFQRLHGLPVDRADDGFPKLTGPITGGAYRRVAWERMGGLDESVFAYTEEFDLALRLRMAGWKAVAATDAVGVHLGSATHGLRSASQRRHAGFGRAHMLRRYGVLRSRAAPRALVMEAIVVVADLVTSRDLAALRGRLAGWRAAAGKPRLQAPSDSVIDRRITFMESLRLRRCAYGRGEGAKA